jgi:hypothetical protein
LVFQSILVSEIKMEIGRMQRTNLDALSQEFFLHKFTLESPARRPATLWLFFGLILFPLVLISVGGSDDFPKYVNITSYVISSLHFLSIVPCIFFSSKQRINRHLQGFISTTIVVTWLFQVEVWMTITIFGMALTCTDGGNLVDPGKGGVAFVAALAVLLSGVITQIFMYRRMERRILDGHFRKGGKGFWGDWKHKDTISSIIAIVAPLLMLFGAASVFISKFWTITWDKAYAPAAMVVAPLLAYSMFFICTYGNTFLFIRKYYIKRFGIANKTIV